MQHLGGSGTPVLYIGRTVLNIFQVMLDVLCIILEIFVSHVWCRSHLSSSWVRRVVMYVQICVA